MKFFYLTILLLLTTSCYTLTEWPARSYSENIKAVTSSGDSLNVNIHNSYNLFLRDRSYYDGWRFYYNRGWIAPDYYFRSYYIPIYVYRNNSYIYYPQPLIYKNDRSNDTKIKRETKPRSSGTTSKGKSRDVKEGKKRTRSSEKKEKE